MPRLNNEMRNETVGMLQAGVSQRELASRFNGYPCTLRWLLRRYLQAGSNARL